MHLFVIATDFPPSHKAGPGPTFMQILHGGLSLGPD